jgi:hypothetical protein
MHGKRKATIPIRKYAYRAASGHGDDANVTLAQGDWLKVMAGSNAEAE